MAPKSKAKAAPAKAKAAPAKTKAAPAKAKAAPVTANAKASTAKAKPEPKPEPKAKGKAKETPKRSASKNDVSSPPLKKQKSEAQIETQTVKGRAAVDKLYPGHAGCHVYQEPGCIWDCMLNQSDVKNNNNKFYIIQLLEKDNGGGFVVWNRWGRVGVPGQNSTTDCGKNLNQAKGMFQSKFTDKTKNAWGNRAQFVKHAGKYHLIEMDYGVDGEDAPVEEAVKKATPPSELPTEIQNFVKLICDVDMMKRQMVEVGYDAKKMPLGKISKKMITDGYDVLQKIAIELEKSKKNNQVLADLSSQFFTVIPHNFGFQAMSNFIINTPDKLKQKLLMVEALADIEVAHRLIESKDDDSNPIDQQYSNLKCKMTPMDPASDTWKTLEEYVHNTHGHTHSRYTLKVTKIFEVDREGEAARFKKFEKNPNRMLLWHGSRLTNWMGIISQGLRIAPPEAPVTGYMFGKGVYFADMVSKSANYCFTNPSNNHAVMMLAEVAIGKSNELKQSNYHADQLPAGCLSTLGLGRTAPDPAGAEIILDGVKVPKGISKDSGISDTSLQYNEFIVYDVAQIRMRYLLEMDFLYK